MHTQETRFNCLSSELREEPSEGRRIGEDGRRVSPDFHKNKEILSIKQTTSSEEVPEGLEIIIDVQGFCPEEVGINIRDKRLDIKVEKKNPLWINHPEFIQRQLQKHQIHYSFLLDESIEEKQVRAYIDDEKLYVRFPIKDPKTHS